MALKSGDKVKVEYTGTFDDGKVFDSTEKAGAPLEFEIGKGQVIPGFEKALTDMKKDDEKNIKLKAADAYGEPNPELVKKVPKDQFPKDGPELKAGMILAVKLPTGQQMPVVVKEVGKNEVTMDMNHPLAGKTLNFKLKLVDVAESK